MSNITKRKRNDLGCTFQTPFDLFDSFNQAVSQINSIFDDVEDFYGPSKIINTLNFQNMFIPPIQVMEKEKYYEFVIETPGLQKEDVSIEISKTNTLIVQGEKKKEEIEKNEKMHISEIRYGIFRREVQLPENTLNDKIDATFKDGVLKIVISKKETTQIDKEENIKIEIK